MNEGRKTDIATCHVRGQCIELHQEGQIEEFRAATYATKEPETLEWIDRYLRQGDVFFDVGANIGLYSLYAAKKLNGDCQVFAFEPEALNYAQLTRNILLNGLAGRILPCCLAVSDRLGFSPFHINPEDFALMSQGRMVPGSSGHSFLSQEDYLGRTFRPSMVQGMLGISLDTLCFQLGVPLPRLVKIDVDGLEDRIIAGMAALLRDPRLKSVLVEASPRPGQADGLRQALTVAGLVEDTDYLEHSRTQLVGTAWEGCENLIYVRPAA